MRFAVIPTTGRPCLQHCLDAITPQVDATLMIRTSAEVLPKFVYEYKQVSWKYDPDPVPNISRWWNMGLSSAHTVAAVAGAETWDVAIVNDDAIVPPGWFHDVSAWMRENGAAAGCQGPHTLVQYNPVAIPLDQRMTGYAFILAGEKMLRLDEGFHWWAGDDDLDWRAREAGGMAMLSGTPVQHLYPNGQVNAELQARIALDMQYFVDKWGRRPW